MKPLIPYPATPQIERKLLDKHNVRFREVAELFARNPLILRGLIDQYGQRRYTALGQTTTGRYLLAIFVAEKHRKARVITARDLTQRQKHMLRSRRRR